MSAQGDPGGQAAYVRFTPEAAVDRRGKAELAAAFCRATAVMAIRKTPPLYANPTELARDSVSARSIDLVACIIFAVRARLGCLQSAAKEQFVPLVAQEIL
jgi:hypothetical protein